MEKTTLYLTAEIARGLKDVSRRTGRRRAELVREALEEYLRNQPSQPLSFIGVAEDTELSAADAKAWVRAQWDEASRQR